MHMEHMEEHMSEDSMPDQLTEQHMSEDVMLEQHQLQSKPQG